ncbi:DNA mismatch repair protein [Lophiotrema nucula]|uniref:DNA mismatch repair protein n=1 Tax=Lophiotrema nucula TaxID=690887 RepID=A0A6A5ZHC9_9PLEO|nr:DNA mismatch repair protein [Lophiotrema nucula]
MARRLSEGGAAAGTSGRGRGPISRLPDEVVAQLKSSTAITSLTGVVLELLKNSLDAEATKIEATVDFGRGGCSVEDNGLGIAPLEFREDGGLGKLYCTSKYYSHGACLGRNGTFLASLASMCLLTITSRHHEHRSHNTIVFHHSKTIQRQLPALQQHEISHESHGTRVAVRNLFGNLPVRVKQRAVAAEQKPELDRLWDVLTREVAGLLLSWGQSIHLRIRDASNQTILKMNDLVVERSAMSAIPTSPKPRSATTQLMLNVLSQAGLISVDEWPAWVPVSASTPRISIRGSISLDPAPTKRVQFISFGPCPLSAEAGHNELYDEVNRIFGLSSFGTIEDDTDIGEAEKLRRESDNRYKHDGYSNRQLRGRKGVDRYPKFHLRVSLRYETDCKPVGADYLNNESNLQTVVEVLGAMVTQWLAVHHFRPRKKRAKRVRPDTASTATDDVEEGSPVSTPSQTPGEQSLLSPTTLSLRPSTSGSGSKKRKTLGLAGPRPASARLHHLPFTSWSRIKSGKGKFYDELWSSSRTMKQKENDMSLIDADPLANGDENSIHFTPFTNDCIQPGAFGAPPSQRAEPRPDTGSESQEDPNPEDRDETTTWTDPATKRKFLLNARTGCIIPRELSGPRLAPKEAESASTLAEINKSLRIRPSSSRDKNTPWLDSLLGSWDNPVFQPTVNSIQKVALEEFPLDNAQPHWSRHHICSRMDMNTAFNEASAPNKNKLSKQGLQDAKIIAQVDRKFILVKMPNASQASTGPEVLVLIDQHAADERIRVESLLAELCAPLSIKDNHSEYRSKLGHTSQIAFSILEKPLQFDVSLQERELFVTHAARFAAWGILYDIMSPRSASMGRDERVRAVLSVAALPPGIAERCKADPKLLINILRSTVWKYADEKNLPPLPAFDENLSSEDNASPVWLRRLSTCPQGVIDLINSRACRSAIMFNDELSLDQCNTLVHTLAQCVFPFMCAHGRPSMIPLVDLGKVGDGAINSIGQGFGLQSEESTREKSFVDAWKEWKR